MPPRATRSTPPTATAELSEAEARLFELIDAIERLAPEVSEAALGVAARRVSVLATIGTHLELVGEGGMAPGGEEHDNDAGSVGSFADEPDEPEEEEEEPGEEQHEVVMPFEFDCALARHGYRFDGGGGFELSGGRVPADATAEDGELMPRDARLGTWHGRDSIGLSAHGRELYCDYCDLGGGVAIDCMAMVMLQERDVAGVVEKHQKRRRLHARADVNGGEARHACYKCIVASQFKDPLGAEQRVRLPGCVTRCVRRLFPNPACGSGCDYDDACVACGHYAGFRTAAQSRALREGALFSEVGL
jgi:hypothetical protein